MKKYALSLLVYLIWITSTFAIDTGVQTITEMDGRGVIQQKKVVLLDGIEQQPYQSENSKNIGNLREIDIIWQANDPVAIAQNVSMSGNGELSLVGWNLNRRRVSAYLTEGNGIPVWEDSVRIGMDGARLKSSTDGNVMAGSAYRYVNRYNPLNGEILWTHETGNDYTVADMTVSPNGTLILVLLNTINSDIEDHRLLVLNQNGDEQWFFDFNADENYLMQAVIISPNNQRIAVTSYEKAYVFNSTGTVLFESEHYGQTSPALSADGGVLVTGDFSGYANVYLWRDGEYLRFWRHRFLRDGSRANWVTAVAVSADGQKIAAGALNFMSSGYSGQIKVFDLANPYPLWSDDTIGDFVEGLKFNSDGSILAMGSWGAYDFPEDQIRIYETATAELLYGYTVPGSIFSVDMAIDGQYVFFGGKHVHARMMGNGGDVYAIRIDLGGGAISGMVQLENSDDHGGVKIEVLDTNTSAISAEDGSYRIENIPLGTYEIRAGKRGYAYTYQENIVVNEDELTPNVDFQLTPIEEIPLNLQATDGAFLDHIRLTWESPAGMISFKRQNDLDLALAGLSSILPKRKDVLVESNLIQGNPASERFGEIRTPTTPLYYSIYRSTLSTGPYFLMDIVPHTETAYSDTFDIFPLQPYYYVVTAVYEEGESAYSNEDEGSLNDEYLEFSIDVPPRVTIPVLDGNIEPGEWDDAYSFDISDVYGFWDGRVDPPGTVTCWMKQDDARHQLYIAVADYHDDVLDISDQVGLYFDDNGDGGYPSFDWDLQEGNFWMSDSVFFRPWFDIGRGETINISEELTSLGISDINGHVEYEFAIPLGFRVPWQLQVFQPEQTPGLWMFVSDASTGYIHGYWPQITENWRDPAEYGGLHLPVTLDAPPQSPHSVELIPEGDGLRLNWSDPQYDRANAPLTDLTAIRIYRNGQLWQTIPPNTETVFDEDVHPYHWYEYMLKAVDGSDQMSPYSEVVGLWVDAPPEMSEIAYDDGTYEGFYIVSFQYDDNKFAVRFTPTEYPVYVGQLKAFVNNNYPFDFAIYDDQNGLPGDIIAGPYETRLDGEGPDWTVLNVPGDDPPLITSGDFWVAVHWHPDSPDAPAIGGDRTQLFGRSYYYLNSTGWVRSSIQNDMIRAAVYDEEYTSVSKKNQELVPSKDMTLQTYPNPFNAKIQIKYYLPRASEVNLSVYNMEGQLVKILVDNPQKEGYYTVLWEGDSMKGRTISSGIYVVRLNQLSQKVVLLK